MANPLSIILSKVKVGVVLSCCMTGMGGRCKDLMAFHGNVVDAVRMVPGPAQEEERFSEPSPAFKPTAAAAVIQNCNEKGQFPTDADKGVYFKVFFDVGVDDSSFDPDVFLGSRVFYPTRCRSTSRIKVVKLPCVHVDAATKSVLYGDPQADPADKYQGFEIGDAWYRRMSEKVGIFVYKTGLHFKANVQHTEQHELIKSTMLDAPVCYDREAFRAAIGNCMLHFAYGVACSTSLHHRCLSGAMM